ncbi:MAG: hypothetical protein CR967_02165 [Proteobacteria bacterium]|nr:MAG: hypothetical protein CR967_02165 [Pseudomonadota bacterium]
MAKELNVHPSTISRELKRNSSLIMKRYTANKVQKIAQTRRYYTSSISNKKMTNDLKNISS